MEQSFGLAVASKPLLETGLTIYILGTDTDYDHRDAVEIERRMLVLKKIMLGSTVGEYTIAFMLYLVMLQTRNTPYEFFCKLFAPIYMAFAFVLEYIIYKSVFGNVDMFGGRTSSWSCGLVPVFWVNLAMYAPNYSQVLSALQLSVVFNDVKNFCESKNSEHALIPHLSWDTQSRILVMLCVWSGVLHLALIIYWAGRMQSADGKHKLEHFVEMADAANLEAIAAAGRHGRDFGTKRRARFLITLLTKMPKITVISMSFYGIFLLEEACIDKYHFIILQSVFLTFYGTLQRMPGFVRMALSEKLQWGSLLCVMFGVLLLCVIMVTLIGLLTAIYDFDKFLKWLYSQPEG